MMQEFHRINGTVMSYKDASAFAKQRDGNRCMCCDHDGSEFRLETHHRNKKAYGPGGSYGPCRPRDLVTLCAGPQEAGRCHELHTQNDRQKRYGAKDHSRHVGQSINSAPKSLNEARPKAAARFGLT